MKFADTSYFLALLNPKDQWHSSARTISASINELLITTDWVLLELADAMLAGERNRHSVTAFIHMLRNREDVRVVPASRGYFDAGLHLFQERLDKEWSLTDCISFVVMGQNGVSEALTADHHFAQAGYRILLQA